MLRRGLFLLDLRIYKLECRKEDIDFPEEQHWVCFTGRGMNGDRLGFSVFSVLGQSEQTYKHFKCL